MTPSFSRGRGCPQVQRDGAKRAGVGLSRHLLATDTSSILMRFRLRNGRPCRTLLVADVANCGLGPVLAFSLGRRPCERVRTHYVTAKIGQ